MLVTGETGTGKEVAAREAHRLSGRRGAFVAVNCAAIPKDLVESKLFGHVRGAFTGATDNRPGVFVEADGGTLLLDEVGDLPLEHQAKLLRVLEDRVVVPVGGSRGREVDVRIIAATNVPLPEAVEERAFRGDLLARLSQCAVRLPPLRERREDVLYLFESFAGLALDRMGPDAAEAVLVYDWPFNVRELRSFAERWKALGGDEELTLDDLDEDVIEHLQQARHVASVGDGAPSAAITREEVTAALELCSGNVTRAARRLGFSRATMNRRLKEFDIQASLFRPGVSASDETQS